MLHAIAERVGVEQLSSVKAQEISEWLLHFFMLEGLVTGIVVYLFIFFYWCFTQVSCIHIFHLQYGGQNYGGGNLALPRSNPLPWSKIHKLLVDQVLFYRT